MKNINLQKNKFKPKFLRKYNYNIDEVIGCKDEEKFKLFASKKLIRIYRDSLNSKSLLSTYIPIDHALFYSFEIDKNVLEKVDLDNFVETKIYEEAGVDETEKYIIKYKVVDSLKDEKLVSIEAIIVPFSYINSGYKNIVEKTGYIDYISFPAFAYESLYEEKILKKANDLFIVFLYDKVFLTFYHNGELLSIITISGGLDKIYESLSKLKIKNFDIDVFKKLIQKKGVNSVKYNNNEKSILDILNDGFLSVINIINEQLEKVILKYNIEEIDRIYVTSEYANIEGLQDYMQKIVGIDTFGFEFYEDYNLDRLAVDPFLFLGMLETHVAYKNQSQKYNFSLFLRKPTFFYRPSGRLLLIFLITFILVSIYPLYLLFNAYYYENENKKLQKNIKTNIIINGKLTYQLKKLTKTEKNIEKENLVYLKSVNEDKNFINNIYKFKYQYIPKSNELTEITILMNKYNVYLTALDYKNNKFELNVFSFEDTKIPILMDVLVKKGFNVFTDGVKFSDGKYKSTIRIEE